MNIAATLARITYTYTNLNTYENICPHQFFRRYLVRDIPYKETKEMKFGNDVHTAFELRIGGKKLLPVEMQQWEGFATPFDRLQPKCEQKVGMMENGQPCDFWDKKVFIRGKLDVVLQNNTKAYMVDWKTGKTREDPFELEVGAMMLRAQHPELTSIQGQYCWLKENQLGKMYDLSDVPATIKKVGGIVRKIEADRKSGEFAKRPSGLCPWCDVYDCEYNRNPNKPQ